MSWHADDETVLRTPSGNVTIVSISWGATRTFGVKKDYQVPKDALTVDMEHGRVLVMQGKTQQH